MLGSTRRHSSLLLLQLDAITGRRLQVRSQSEEEDEDEESSLVVDKEEEGEARQLLFLVTVC